MASEKYELTDQAQRSLPRNTLFLMLGCCTASLFVSFFDQTAVTTSIPSIGKTLNDSSVVNIWIGSSYLIANTNFQLLYGRFSDIFGRKQIFLFTLACLLVGNLVSGFAKNSVMLFIFRALSGLGGGGINCLVMITFSDLLTTRERGKYFGFVALSTTLGNGVGPLIGGVLSEKATWRWAFWISCPIAVVCAALLVFFVPFKPVEGDFKSKLVKLDWMGALMSIVGTVLVLVGVSGGGNTWAWNSATFVVLIVIGGLASVALVVVEHYAKIPMIPLHLFSNLQRNVLFTMCFLMGWCYFVDIYYFPLYLQNIRNWSPIMSGVIQLPSTASSSIFGIIAGFINSKMGKYAECLYFGGAMWVLGTGLKILFDYNSSVGLLVGSNLIQGLGIGFTFQPTLLALLANSEDRDRAVVTGIRNFFRSFGGAVGLIISGVVFDSYFKSKLIKNSGLSRDNILGIVSDISKTSELDKDTKKLVLDQYLSSFKLMMIILTVLSGFMFVFSLLARDGKFKPEEPETKEPDNNDDKEEATVNEREVETESSDELRPKRTV